MRSFQNQHIQPGVSSDHLYHFALSTDNHDLKAMFGDVKFVCLGGSPKRMESMAFYLLEELAPAVKLSAGTTLTNIAGGSDRYVMFKVGPVLCMSHGMGTPSLSILLHELVKLLHHAECTDVTVFRIGTSGGIGLAPGSVVVTREAVNDLLEPYYRLSVLGKEERFPTCNDPAVREEIISLVNPDEDGFVAIEGNTMCTNDFYEGQARLDGAFCNYTEEDKQAFLRLLHEKGVRNIEMESTVFSALLNRAGIRSAVICTTLLDRFHGDQISVSREILSEWEKRPQMIVARYVKKKLGIFSQ